MRSYAQQIAEVPLSAVMKSCVYNLKEVKSMVGLESSMDLAESAKKTKKPEVDSAERERQKKFYEQLRNRTAPVPEA